MRQVKWNVLKTVSEMEIGIKLRLMIDDAVDAYARAYPQFDLIQIRERFLGFSTLHFYKPYSSTIIDTIDLDLVIPLFLPVLSDSVGVFPNVLPVENPYRVELRDVNDRLIVAAEINDEALGFKLIELNLEGKK